MYIANKDITTSKKVIILQDYLAPYRVNLFNELNKFEDIELYLIYTNKFEKRRKWNFNLPKKFNEIQLRSLVIPFSYEKNITIPNVFQLIWILISLRPDTIICFSTTEGLFLRSFKSIFKFNLISWLEVTEVTEKNVSAFKIKFRNYFFRAVNSFIIPGKSSLNFLVSSGYLGNQKFYTASNTIDDVDFSLTETEVMDKFEKFKCLRFLFSGSLIVRKGFDLLQKAIEHLNKQNYKIEYEIIIAGDGELEKKVIDNVIYTGHLQGTDYCQIFKKSHVLILPSIQDPNPLTVIEALKSGNILAVSDGVGSHPEVIINNGYVFKRDDWQAIYLTMDNILKTPKDELKKMGLNSLNIAKEISHFNSAESFHKAIIETKQ